MAIALVSPGVPDPPYGPIKANGIMFRIDYERVNQSDTWGLAPPELRPWLLMMWFVAWQHIPCGSLSPDEKAIAAHIGMPWAMWLHHREVLMRGWYRCSDGRLYHKILSEFVCALEGWRAGNRDRAALHRSKKQDEDIIYGTARKQGLTGDVTRYSRVSNKGVRQPEPEPEVKPKKNLKTKSEAIAPSPASQAIDAAVSPVVISIPLNGGGEFGITEALVAEWTELYPSVDIIQTLREIRGWNLANPSHRKTRGGLLKHVNAWLSKEQNKG